MYTALLYPYPKIDSFSDFVFVFLLVGITWFVRMYCEHSLDWSPRKVNLATAVTIIVLTLLYVLFILLFGVTPE